METTSSIVSKFISQVGYGLDSATTTASFLAAVQSSGTIIDTLFLKTNELTMAHTAGTLATMLDYLWASGLNGTVVDAVNFMNGGGMAEGWEIVLGRFAPNSTALEFLSTLKYKSLCPQSVCSNPLAGVPLRRALAGIKGYVLGPDYASVEVIAGHSPLPLAGLGLVYKCQLSVLQKEFLTQAAAAIEDWNKVSAGSLEMMLMINDNGAAKLLTELELSATCGDICDISALNFAFRAPQGTYVGPDYRGVNVLAAYTFLTNLNATLLLKIDLSHVQTTLLQRIGSAISATNSKLPGTKELFASHKVTSNDTAGIEFISDLRYASQCGALGCGSNPNAAIAAKRSAVDCEQGYIIQQDYRNHAVFAGYACIPEIQCGMS